jgi:hypothetical protein
MSPLRYLIAQEYCSVSAYLTKNTRPFCCAIHQSCIALLGKTVKSRYKLTGKTVRFYNTATRYAGETHLRLKACAW